MQTDTVTLREPTVRYSARKDSDGRSVAVGRALSNPKDAASTFLTLLQDEPAEVFAMLCLDDEAPCHRVSRSKPRHLELDACASARGVQGGAAREFSHRDRRALCGEPRNVRHVPQIVM